MDTVSRNRFWLRFRNQDRSFVDALILAGDIGSLAPSGLDRYRDLLARFCELYPRVFMVIGNHENWGVSISRARENLRSISTGLKNLVVLEAGEPRELRQGLNIGGDTLWFPDCGDYLLKKNWCDYAYIRDSHEIHDRHSEFLKYNLPDICVTHHFPTEEAIAPEWKGNLHNCFYHTGLDDDLGSRYALGLKIPRLWIFGHSHNPMDFHSQFGFRGYSNPLGYQSEGLNPEFFERMLIDTDDSPVVTNPDPLPQP